MKRFMLSIVAFFMILTMFAGAVSPAFAAGCAPVAENMELKTYRNTSVGGQLSAYDPEDDVVSFEITTKPIKGSISVEQNGSFVYTPDSDKKGRDYFGYKAIDSEGNVSQEATVIIRIEKQKPIEYKDMDKRGGEYAAATLSARGIFTGESICGEYSFGPDKELSRGEFMNMCLALSDEQGIISRKFADDLSKAISHTEAVEILNDVLKINDVSYVPDYIGEDTAVQACINMNAVGVINEPVTNEDSLTREEAALMLVSALRIIENR